MTGQPKFWNRDFLLLYQGGLVSALGDQAYLIALMLWAKEYTASATVNGFILFAGGITGLLMPLGGALADRHSRVRMLVLLDAASGVSVLTLAALLWCSSAVGPLLIPAVLALAVARGVCMALFYPVEAALMPDLVPKQSIAGANSLLESTTRTVQLLGQSTAGLLYVTLGAPLLLLFDGVSFLLSALSETFIREPPREQPKPHERPSLLTSLREGFRYTGRVRGFRIYLLEASFANFYLAALTVGLPYYVVDRLGASPAWYGYISAVMGLGAIVGNQIANFWRTPGRKRGTIQILSLALFSGCLIPLAFVRSVWGAMAILGAAWVCVGFHQVLLMTLVQKRTPAAMRGRVLGLLAMIRQCLTPIGAATFGLLIDKLAGGVTQVLFWCGVLGLATILIAAAFPAYRDFFGGAEEEVPA